MKSSTSKTDLGEHFLRNYNRTTKADMSSVKRDNRLSEKKATAPCRKNPRRFNFFVCLKIDSDIYYRETIDKATTKRVIQLS